MSILVHENFSHDWEKSWEGKIHSASRITTGWHGDGLELLFPKGSHYGSALHKEVPPCRHVKVSYRVKILSNWDSHSTGITLGFADLRHKNSKGQSNGHGNRRPDPDGFSFRTWFGKSKNGVMPIGMYVYHLGQKPRWGDSIKVGQVTIGGAPITFECEADFDEGFIRARIDDGDWVRHNIVVTDKTAVTWAWLDAYYGGPAVSPKDMAWEISDYKLENLGPDVADPGIDWDAIAKLVAAKEEAEKETAESEVMMPEQPLEAHVAPVEESDEPISKILINASAALLPTDPEEAKTLYGIALELVQKGR